MDYEAILNQALDLLADNKESKAERLLQGIIDHLKKRLDGSQADLDLYYYWGRALTAMDEPEQALLKFEKALTLNPDHEQSIWETASIFLHDLERPESAQLLLSKKLLPISPDNALYTESLRAAELAMRVKKTPPPGSRPDPIAKPKAGDTPEARERELREAADALLRESGDWSPEDEIDTKP
ncbi:MAG: tetratricopeptide repeat protein [Fibrobacterota bacterium]|nr:tetratricopeptide repeat protein [Fibrobacterota bacterium]